MSQQTPEIVLVENDAILAEVTKFRLELLGYSVTVCQGATEALDTIRSRRPSLVLIDLRINDGNAFELMESLGMDEATTAIPIMVMSTDAELDTVQKAYRAGAADFLVVPYNPMVLDSKVEALVNAVPARA